jgi:hypothetical protein
LRGVLEGYGVGYLVLFFEEIQIVNNGSQLGLFSCVAVDADFELTPSLVATKKWSFGEGWR